MTDLPFKGNWLVNFHPNEYNYPDILVTLAKISDFFNKNGTIFNSLNIIFNKNSIKNYYFKEKDEILLLFSSFDEEFDEISTKPCEPAMLKSQEKPIKTISFLFPRLESDPRWKSMGVPAGQVFLASNLSASGFKPSALPLTLPGENPPVEALNADMTGITLFEDLLAPLRPFLAIFRGKYTGVIAAGGPFPTLAPLAAAFHLPQVNLLVRGEAEMSLPGILDALKQGDAEAFFAHKGVLWQQPGLIAISGLDLVIRPKIFDNFGIDLSFLKPGQTSHGLEMNFSRGCRRGCVFCCRVQGSEFRKLPLDKAEELLKKFAQKIDEFSGGADADRTVNINDDDILQDPGYAREIFALLKTHSFRIYGIQTSPSSLVKSDGSPKEEALGLAADPGLFVAGSPLLWLGTDVFLPARARRLGKRLPPPSEFAGLLEEFEKRGLRHFHYWISSDGDSTWEEFVGELALIFGYFRDFPGFGLLAHAPFIVPYPASRMFAQLPARDPRLKIKLALEAPDPRFSYKIVDRIETRWPQLNKLLRNEIAGGEFGFFDLLKAKDLKAAAQLAYHFLKQEELQSNESDPGLQRARERLELLIAELL